LTIGRGYDRALPPLDKKYLKLVAQ